MGKKQLSAAPIWDDMRTFCKESGSFPSDSVDVIYGGFPCQDISIAGAAKGLGGERSVLFFEIIRLAKEIKPSFIFLENVPAITSRGGAMVCLEIASLGYDCRWCVISAASVGASHIRERWFLLAHSKGERFKQTRLPIRSEKRFSLCHNSTEYEPWDKEPENKFEVVRVVNGIQARAHRIRALGNSVVPQQAKKAFKMLMGLV